MNRIDFEAEVGATEVWTITNKDNWPHNFHVHDVQFQILDVDGRTPPPHLRGLKDNRLHTAGQQGSRRTAVVRVHRSHVPVHVPLPPADARGPRDDGPIPRPRTGTEGGSDADGHADGQCRCLRLVRTPVTESSASGTRRGEPDCRNRSSTSGSPRASSPWSHRDAACPRSPDCSSLLPPARGPANSRSVNETFSVTAVSAIPPITARSTTRRRSSGVNTISPSAIRRMAPSNSAGSVSLTKNPEAPAASAGYR